jgi:hypothetical protein
LDFDAIDKEYEIQLNNYKKNLQRSFDRLVSKKYDDQFNGYSDYAKSNDVLTDPKRKKK